MLAGQGEVNAAYQRSGQRTSAAVFEHKTLIRDAIKFAVMRMRDGIDGKCSKNVDNRRIEGPTQFFLPLSEQLFTKRQLEDAGSSSHHASAEPLFSVFKERAATTPRRQQKKITTLLEPRHAYRAGR
jgi:hypothetical protein